MDIQQAFDILEIDLKAISLTNLTHEYIKKKYHKLALINHPDKNGDTNKFQRINEAYEYLSKELYIINGIKGSSDTAFAQGSANAFAQGSAESAFVSSDTNQGNNGMYIYLLSLFIGNIIDGPNAWNKEVIKNVIKEIVTLGKNISLERIFLELDKDGALEVYSFICKYKHVLYINTETLEFVSSLIRKKYKNDRVFILNPSIIDLLDSNIFKLYVGEELYLVPLWHNELYFQAKTQDSEIIVLCDPELEEKLAIDEDNNIHVTLDIECTNLLDIMKEGFYSLVIGDRSFSIPINDLYIKKEQIYKFVGQGIANVIENDMYNISCKADIIVKIRII
jgi:curved DNA-binding protein CbpA